MSSLIEYAPSVLPFLLPILVFVIAWYMSAPKIKRLAAVIFIVVPGVIVVVLLFVFLPVWWQIFMVRLVFLLSVCLLPGILYFLFIANRRDSLLNEYLSNLLQLGLSSSRCVPAGPDCVVSNGELLAPVRLVQENEASRRRRLRTYLERFQAKYGPLPEGKVDEILDATAPERIATEGRPEVRVEFEWSQLLSAVTTIPLIATTALIALGWFLTLPPLDGAIDPGTARTEVAALAKTAFAAEPAPALPEPAAGLPGSITGTVRDALQPDDFSPVHFAFLGAYFFSLQMLFRRYVRRDLEPRAYIGVSLRIILAVIGVWFTIRAVAYFQPELPANADAYLVLAALVGAFPQVVLQILKGATSRLPLISSALPTLHAALPTSDLDGVTVWHQARLEEEDIENVPNMATADVVELMLHTRFPPDRIIDWIDQAILYTHIGVEEDGEGSARARLRAHGIRTASGLIEAYRKAYCRGDLTEFEAILPGESGRARLRSMVDTLATNPNLALVYNWRGLQAQF